MRAVAKWFWHVDEVFKKINGERHYLWRAVDHEGEVLKAVVAKRRGKCAAQKFLRKLMRRYGQADQIVTDRLPSYRAARKELGAAERQETGRWLNNRAENSHVPLRRRERAMQRFRRMRRPRKFTVVCSSGSNRVKRERGHSRRDVFKTNCSAVPTERRGLDAA